MGIDHGVLRSWPALGEGEEYVLHKYCILCHNEAARGALILIFFCRCAPDLGRKGSTRVYIYSKRLRHPRPRKPRLPECAILRPPLTLWWLQRAMDVAPSTTVNFSLVRSKRYLQTRSNRLRTKSGPYLALRYCHVEIQGSNSSDNHSTDAYKIFTVDKVMMKLSTSLSPLLPPSDR